MNKLNPDYICGLVDGEGCFCVSISKHKTKRLGFDPRLIFEIEMIIEDKPLLETLQTTLKCGNIYILNYKRYGWRPHVKFAVKSYKDISKIIIQRPLEIFQLRTSFLVLLQLHATLPISIHSIKVRILLYIIIIIILFNVIGKNNICERNDITT